MSRTAPRIATTFAATVWIASILALTLGGQPAPALAGDRAVDEPSGWSQWRGPHRDGTFEGPAWPESLGEKQLQVRWSVPLGPSYSGPIVSDSTVFTTSSEDGTHEVVTAIDRASGEVRWQKRWEGSMTVPFFAAANGNWIRATPAYDGDRLYVAGMRDVLVALDAESGDVVWRIDFPKKFETPLPTFGFVSSPMIDGDFLYVQAGASFVKIEKDTGDVVWRTSVDAGGMNGSIFSSPAIATLADKRQLVIQTRSHLKGIDEDSGDELWSLPVKSFRGMAILTPMEHDGGIFMSAHSGITQLVDITKSDEGFKAAPRWTNKLEAYMSSPVFHDGHAYMHLRNNRIACIDLATGEETWRTTPFGKYQSMIVRGDRILSLDERGDLLLIAADPKEFRLLDSRHLSDASTWAHLAVDGSDVYVRALDKMWALRFNRSL